jgi:hypothetical protein
LAIPPNLDRTIQVFTRNNVVLGLLQTYTEPVARGTNKGQDWITSDEIISTIKQAYKRATNNEIDPQEVTPYRIGTLLKDIYPDFMGRKENKSTRNGKMRYNLTLLTIDEVENKNNEVLEVLPLGEHQKLFGDLQNKVYNKIKQGVNTQKKLYEELDDDNRDIDDTIQELYIMGVVISTRTQRLD